jgi:hypothetical protein
VVVVVAFLVVVDVVVALFFEESAYKRVRTQNWLPGDFCVVLESSFIRVTARSSAKAAIAISIMRPQRHHKAPFKFFLRLLRCSSSYGSFGMEGYTDRGEIGFGVLYA